MAYQSRAKTKKKSRVGNKVIGHAHLARVGTPAWTSVNTGGPLGAERMYRHDHYMRTGKLPKNGAPGKYKDGKNYATNTTLAGIGLIGAAHIIGASKRAYLPLLTAGAGLTLASGIGNFKASRSVGKQTNTRRSAVYGFYYANRGGKRKRIKKGKRR